MAYRREYLQYLTTSADANPHVIELDTPDNFQTQHIKTLFLGSVTAGVEVGIGMQGKVYANVDASWFAVGDKELPLTLEVPAGNPPQVTIIDHTSAGLTAIGFMIGYEVDQP